MNREIGLVSCVKTKRDEPATPKDLYTSAYFWKIRTYAETYHDDWWILSAKHHLLGPDGPPIEPYEETVPERRSSSAVSGPPSSTSNSPQTVSSNPRRRL